MFSEGVWRVVGSTWWGNSCTSCTTCISRNAIDAVLLYSTYLYVIMRALSLKMTLIRWKIDVYEIVGTAWAIPPGERGTETRFYCFSAAVKVSSHQDRASCRPVENYLEGELNYAFLGSFGQPRRDFSALHFSFSRPLTLRRFLSWQHTSWLQEKGKDFRQQSLFSLLLFWRLLSLSWPSQQW